MNVDIEERRIHWIIIMIHRIIKSLKESFRRLSSLLLSFQKLIQQRYPFLISNKVTYNQISTDLNMIVDAIQKQVIKHNDTNSAFGMDLDRILSRLRTRYNRQKCIQSINDIIYEFHQRLPKRSLLDLYLFHNPQTHQQIRNEVDRRRSITFDLFINLSKENSCLTQQDIKMMLNGNINKYRKYIHGKHDDINTFLKLSSIGTDNTSYTLSSYPSNGMKSRITSKAIILKPQTVINNWN